MTATEDDRDVTADLAGVGESDHQLREWLLSQSDSDGAAVLHIAEEAGLPPFAFTVGTWRRFGVPEAVIVGMEPAAAHSVLETYTQRARAGERFVAGLLYPDFVQESQLLLERVDKGYFVEYFGQAFLLYPDGDFPALQLIYPTPGGVWPWEPAAPAGFADWQPVLTSSGGVENGPLASVAIPEQLRRR